MVVPIDWHNIIVAGIPKQGPKGGRQHNFSMLLMDYLIDSDSNF